ncbi:BMP family ABC transporter substrate-binding protein, partial [Clostridium sp.]|uniref:BMP family ABC transporter substrate-binding protein n=1 Tax=Clostridium sp. TaxID=1506 RepID=UPI00283EA68B
MKKIIALLMTTMMMGTMVGCGSSGTKTADQGNDTGKEYKVAMVTDTGGVNDQSFNQSSWEGLQSFEKNNQGAKVSYLESKQ